VTTSIPPAFSARIDLTLTHVPPVPLVHSLMQPPDPNSGSIMSICFTICSFVSFLLLIFNYRLSRHDGITCIVSTSHGPLVHASHIVQFSPSFSLFSRCCPLHIYDRFIFRVRTCASFHLAFSPVSCLPFFFLPISFGHGTYKFKPTNMTSHVRSSPTRSPSFCRC